MAWFGRLVPSHHADDRETGVPIQLSDPLSDPLTTSSKPEPEHLDVDMKSISKLLLQFLPDDIEFPSNVTIDDPITFIEACSIAFNPYRPSEQVNRDLAAFKKAIEKRKAEKKKKDTGVETYTVLVNEKPVERSDLVDDDERHPSQLKGLGKTFRDGLPNWIKIPADLILIPPVMQYISSMLDGQFFQPPEYINGLIESCVDYQKKGLVKGLYLKDKKKVELNPAGLPVNLTCPKCGNYGETQCSCVIDYYSCAECGHYGQTECACIPPPPPLTRQSGVIKKKKNQKKKKGTKPHKLAK